MASLTYNGVTLPYVDVVGFDCQAVYDDESRTDQILTRFDIKVQCVVSDDSLDLLLPIDADGLAAAGQASPPNIMSSIHSKLMEPRKELSFQFSGVEFIPGKAGVTGTVDAWNGPKPQGFTPIRMEPGSWILLYHIIAHYRVNQQGDRFGTDITFTNLPGNVCLYNRWRESVEIDDREYTKRVRAGKFMIRSDNREGYVADQVRSLMAQVGVPEGFVRARRRYTVSPDGLSIQYEIEDQEVWMMPPAGAYRARGNYHERTTTGDGKRIGTCRVTLWGSKNSVYADMVSTACALVVAKLDLAGANFFGDLRGAGGAGGGGGGVGGFNFERDFAAPIRNALGGALFGGGDLKKAGVQPPPDPAPQPRAMLLNAELDVGMYDNTVTATMQVLYPAGKKVFRGAAWINPSVAKTPGSGTADPKIPYTDRGSASLLLRAAAYYDPDLGATIVERAGADEARGNPATPQGGTALSRGKEPGEAGKNP